MTRFKEQCNGMVKIGSSPSERLPILCAWRNSSTVYWFESPFPATWMKLRIADPDKGSFSTTVNGIYHPKRGLWRAYVPSKTFHKRMETEYKVVLGDETDSRTVAGSGILRVGSNVFEDLEDDVDQSASTTCHILFPDGKWRKMSVFEDDSGALSFSVSDEAVDSSMFERPPSQPFAYSQVTGKFHAVTGFIDSSGTASASCAEEGVLSGEESFALDEKTGVFYRLDAVVDESGTIALKVGEIK